MDKNNLLENVYISWFTTMSLVFNVTLNVVQVAF
ncbi:hypothetical protein F965_02376 [Acinetobacter schindleri NIPH 900]|uniref:Uncharacterized protein n=1 Tax=Acinetobacter schindleri NIPH 900 TaxID=1217675 RepID=N8XZ84_9GAMM|nr:hypothetical protein F965_02376 [Acinetobacter schindleri NIPH 900]